MDTPSGPSPEQLVAGKEDTLELSRALMLLEEGYRVPFMLKHVDGLSYREISKVLDIAESAASTNAKTTPVPIQRSKKLS